MYIVVYLFYSLTLKVIPNSKTFSLKIPFFIDLIAKYNRVKKNNYKIIIIIIIFNAYPSILLH
jgi:hypothetical protein